MTTSNSDQGAVRSILLASPPGQFDIILDDLKKIDSSLSSLLEQNFVASIRNEWEANSGRSILNADDDSDAKSSDHDLCIINLLSKAVGDYIASTFSSHGVRAAHKVTNITTVTSSTTYTITTYAERIDLHNNHVGSWKGQYTICPSSGMLTGNISICAHTFENGGNVQLNSNICLDEINLSACSPSDDVAKQKSWTKAIIRQIDSWEGSLVMSKLEEMYESISKSYMKCLRRAMPITRTKMGE